MQKGLKIQLAIVGVIGCVLALIWMVFRPSDPKAILQPTEAPTVASSNSRAESASHLTGQQLRAASPASASTAAAPSTSQQDAAVKPKLLLGALDEIYARALKQGGVRETTLAERVNIVCVGALMFAKEIGEIGFDKEGIQELLPRAEARQQLKSSLDTLSNYCGSYRGDDFSDRLRAAGRRGPRPYYYLASVNTPPAERFPAIVGVLSMPHEYPLEFTMWASADLHELLTSQARLKDGQAGIVEALVVKNFVKDPAVLEFYQLHQCASRFVCIEGLPPDSPELVAAKPIADKVAEQISRQNWNGLIFRPKVKP